MSDADLSALEKEVVVPVDFSEDVDLAALAALIPSRSDVSTRIGLITPSAIRPDTFSPVIKMTSSTWFIDLSNVMGSVPDGWWRDREGAARRLIDDIRAWAEDDVTVVLDAGPDDLLGTDGGVTVVRAPRRGRDAADDEIVRLVEGRRATLAWSRATPRSSRACGNWARRSRARGRSGGG